MPTDLILMDEGSFSTLSTIPLEVSVALDNLVRKILLKELLRGYPRAEEERFDDHHFGFEKWNWGRGGGHGERENSSRALWGECDFLIFGEWHNCSRI